MIKTKSIYDPVEEDDGMRILITRYYPRGVKKEKFDIWIRTLAPSKELLKGYKCGIFSWEVFEEDFIDEMRKSIESSKELSRITEASKTKNITLLCYERDEHCHRYLVKDLISKPVPPVWVAYA